MQLGDAMPEGRVSGAKGQGPLIGLLGGKHLSLCPEGISLPQPPRRRDAGGVQGEQEPAEEEQPHRADASHPCHGCPSVAVRLSGFDRLFHSSSSEGNTARVTI